MTLQCPALLSSAEAVLAHARLVDVDRLRDLTCADEALCDELVQAFVDQAPDFMQALAGPNMDLAQSMDLLHELQGSACYVAAERLVLMIRSLQQDERLRQATWRQASLARVSQVLVATVAELRARFTQARCLALLQ